MLNFFIITTLSASIIGVGSLFYKLLFGRIQKHWLSILIDYFISGILVLITILFIFSILDLTSFAVPFFSLYTVFGLIGFIFLLLDCHKNPSVFRTLFLNMKNTTPQTILRYLCLLSLLILLFWVLVFYPKMNWDGFKYYLTDAHNILRSDFAFTNNGQDVSVINIPDFQVSFVTSSYYAYFLNFLNLEPYISTLDKIIFYNETFGIVVFFVLVALLVSVYRLGLAYFDDSRKALFVMLFVACTPLLHQYLKLYSLSSDLFFVFLLVNLVYYIKQYKMQIIEHTIYIVGILFLLTITKINGLVFGLIFLLFLSFPQIKFNAGLKKSIALFCLFLLAVVLTLFIFFNIRYPLFVSEYFFQPINFAIFVISFLIMSSALIIGSGDDGWLTPGNLKIILSDKICFFVIALFIFLTLLIPLYYFIETGSPFLGYLVNPNNNIQEIRADTGDWHFINDFMYGILGAGYLFGLFFIFVVFYLKKILINREISQLLSMFLFIYLIWLVVLTPTSIRHLLILSILGPFLIIHILTNHINNDHLKVDNLLLSFLFFTFLSVFIVYVDAFDLDFLSSINWVSTSGAIICGMYFGMVLSYFIFYPAYHKISLNLKKVLTTVLLFMLIGLTWYLSINIINSDHNYYQKDDGSISYYLQYEVFDYINENIPYNSSIINYRIFGMELFTNHNYKYFDLRKPTLAPYVAEINCSDNLYILEPTEFSIWYPTCAKILDNYRPEFLTNKTIIYTSSSNMFQISKISCGDIKTLNN
ncbi:MAG: hypothetical protein ABH842_05540 [Candidatus Micrarchaeota archaeon]